MDQLARLAQLAHPVFPATERTSESATAQTLAASIQETASRSGLKLRQPETAKHRRPAAPLSPLPVPQLLPRRRQAMEMVVEMTVAVTTTVPPMIVERQHHSRPLAGPAAPALGR